MIVAAVIACAAPATAAAAPTASISGSTLSVAGDATAETYTIDQTGTNVHVHTPPGVSGSVAPCSISGGNDISCPVAVVTEIVVDGADGSDTINDNRVVP